MIKVLMAIGATILKLYELLKLAGRADAMTDTQLQSSIDAIDARYEADAARVRRTFGGG